MDVQMLELEWPKPHPTKDGKIVNGTSQSTMRKGYPCLESEGAEIHFRNIKILELPGGRATPEQTAPLVK